MKGWCLLIFLLLTASFSGAQNYFRGEVKDEKGNPLPFVRIRLNSTNIYFSSGNTGGFGIPSQNPTDSLSFFLEGYEERTIRVTGLRYETVVLKLLPFLASLQKPRLLSVTKDLPADEKAGLQPGGETYSDIIENEFISTAKFPATSVVVNTDKASYSNIRRFLTIGSLVPEDAVRIEEMLNYFNERDGIDNYDEKFRFKSALTDCPWDKNRRLFFLNLKTQKINQNKLPPGNFVFLIDISGSMDQPNRLPLLKKSFHKLVNEFRAADTVSIIAYGTTVSVMLKPTSGAEKDTIHRIIDDLGAGGETPGEMALLTAYRYAKNTFKKNGNNRIILATDGDFNVGRSSDEELEMMMGQIKEAGIYLTCLGVGVGNYKDSKLEALARKGNGNFAYIDNEAEGEKVLVDEYAQTLYTIADNVLLNISFNPEMVKEYRLVGYDNRRDAVMDSANELEGGELGYGSSVIAVFELEWNDKYTGNNLSFAKAKVDFELPGDDVRQQEVYECLNNYTPFEKTDAYIRFAASVALFGMQLRRSAYVNDPGFELAMRLAENAIDPENPAQAEYLNMIRQAVEVYHPLIKKKKRKKRSSRNQEL